VAGGDVPDAARRRGEAARVLQARSTGGPGWAGIARTLPGVEADQGLLALALVWVAGVVLVYAALFATGSLIFGFYRNAVVFALLAAVAGALVWRTLSQGPDARGPGGSR